jgi:hypothetical protein
MRTLLLSVLLAAILAALAAAFVGPTALTGPRVRAHFPPNASPRLVESMVQHARNELWSPSPAEPNTATRPAGSDTAFLTADRNRFSCVGWAARMRLCRAAHIAAFGPEADKPGTRLVVRDEAGNITMTYGPGGVRDYHFWAIDPRRYAAALPAAPPEVAVWGHFTLDRKRVGGGARLVIRLEDGRFIEAKTDAAGLFRVQGLTAGTNAFFVEHFEGGEQILPVPGRPGANIQLTPRDGGRYLELCFERPRPR